MLKLCERRELTRCWKFQAEQASALSENRLTVGKDQVQGRTFLVRSKLSSSFDFISSCPCIPYHFKIHQISSEAWRFFMCRLTDHLSTFGFVQYLHFLLLVVALPTI